MEAPSKKWSHDQIIEKEDTKNKKVKRFKVAYDENKIEQLKERIIICRNFLQELEKQNS